MIDRRVPGLVLVLLATGLYAGGTLSTRQAAAEVDAEVARLRGESEALRRRVAEAEPQRASEAAWRQAGPKGDGSVTGLRRLLLQSMAEARVSGVRLSVTAQNPPLAARTSIAALGSFVDLLSLSERLIGPRTGLVPERLRWALTGSELSFELDAIVLARAP
jgi:hypothetical protein